MSGGPQKWTRAWIVRRLIEKTRDLLRYENKTSKDYYVKEGCVRELMDMLESR